MRGLFFVVSKDGRTTFTLDWTPLGAAAEECELFDSFCEGMAIGWKGTFEQLDAPHRSCLPTSKISYSSRGRFDRISSAPSARWLL
jgi:hypothetical protein